MPLLSVATRGSKLALWQAQHVLSLLPRVGLQGRLQIITTRGDRLKDAPLYDFGGKGLFAKEIETALCERRVDLAVHSLKDMPVQTAHTELSFACVLKRASACDVLVCQPRHRALLDGASKRQRVSEASKRQRVSEASKRQKVSEATEKMFVATDLPRWRGLTIGTGSLRRRYLLEQADAGVKVRALRGNVDTRLKHLRQGKFDALLLACAALQRLELQDLPYRVLDPTWYVPSCAQGAIAVQSRIDCEHNALLQQLDCAVTRQAVMLERAVIRALGGSCALPFGCYVRRAVAQRSYLVDAVVLSPVGRQARAAFSVASDTPPETVAAQTVQRLHDDNLPLVLRELGL